MNISYNWLKDLIDFDLSADELAAQLTRVGLAVEGVHPHGEDRVLDVDLTSNRPDCLSHLGVAREIAALTGRKLKVSNEAQIDSAEVPLPAILAYDVVAIHDPDLCHRFTARIIKNVRIAPSPGWLVERLEAIGERAINNVADITNYVMHELGQPMHAFDLEKLSGGRIIVRRAKAGETLKTLDEVDRRLDDTMLAICDAEKPVAIGGVMGGIASGITESTTSVLLEVAYFQRKSIRQTSRKLGLVTEASYRFERGVDIDNLINASNRAAELICEYAGGTLGEFVDVYPTKSDPRTVRSANISRATERLTGLSVSPDRSVEILESLGIAHPDSDPTAFTVPSWRHDITLEEDLVEEVARLVGYENIADELPPAFGAGEYQRAEPRKKVLRNTLTDLGFTEAVSYSFVDTRFDDHFDPVPGILDERAEEPFVTLRDSVIEGAVRMRPTLLAGLLEAVRLNFNHQRRDVKLFEIGKCFASRAGEDGLPTERELLSLVLTGSERLADRAMSEREIDFYDAKGAVEAALEAAGSFGATFAAGDVSHLQPGQSALVSFNGRKLGSIGRLAEELASDYKFKQPVYVAELDLQAILAEEPSTVLYKPLPRYPSIVRDVSFVVDRSVTFDQIRTSISGQGRELCRRVEFVDIYEGKGVAAHQRSITIRLEYRSNERTLLDTEVDAVHEQLVAAAERELNIQRRF